MRKILLLLCCFLFTASGCAAPASPEGKTGEFFAMDTVISYTIYGKDSEDAALSFEQEIYRLERLLSTQLEDSEIAALNRDAEISASPETLGIIEFALEISSETSGAFDISVYPLVKEWGFFSETQSVPSPQRIEKLLGFVSSGGISVSGNTVVLGENMGIDLGGVAKGYASDMAADLLRGAGITSAIISLGGNVYTIGNKPDGSKWKVAIQDPFDLESNIGILEVSNTAVVTSGAYQRYFEENGKVYHHIIDPKTGYPSENGLASVTVVCSSGTLADALSTALFVMGEETAIEFWRESARSFELVLVNSDGEVTVTEGLKDCFDAGSFTVVQR